MNDAFAVKRQQIFEEQARKYLERLDPETGLVRSAALTGHSMHSRAAGYDVRSMAGAMTSWAMTGHDDAAWRALSFVLDNQDLAPDSLTYGNFKWHTDWPIALDPNAVSFIVPHLWYVHRHCAERMPQELLERLREGMRLSLEATNCHRCTVHYTNIVLLNLAVRLCVADALDWPRARAIAGWEWEEWRNAISRLGFIPEYNSPAYTAVQIDALAIMLACKAEPAMHDEIRRVMRHLITEAVANYHPAIGMVTGPQSRGNYHHRGHTYLDTIYHFVLGAPEPTDGCHLWLGVPLTAEDLLPDVRPDSLPRLNENRGPDFRRLNYLAPDFAVGSVNGQCHITSHNTAFHVAFRTEAEHCAFPIVANEYALVERLFATQREGLLLGGAIWRIDPTAVALDDQRTGSFSGLNTGRPERLIRDPDFRPGFTVALGPAASLSMRGGDGQALAVKPGEVPLQVLVVTTPSVHVGWRWFGIGDQRVQLVDDEGCMTLAVSGSREGHAVNERETAVWSGFLLHVVPVDEMSAEELAASLTAAPVVVTADDEGWQVQAGAMSATVDARPALIYAVGDYRVTSNQWIRD